MAHPLRFLTTAFLITLCLQLVGKELIREQAANGRWIESAFSKLALLENNPQKTTVLIGTSTVQNNFNTTLMAEFGVPAFNLGLPGRYWEYYPHLMRELAHTSVTTVIVSLSVRTLFDPVACPQVFGLKELWVLLRERPHCLLENSLTHLLPLTSERPYLWIADPLPSRAELDLAYGTALREDPRKMNFLRGQGDRKVLTFTNGDGLVLNSSQSFGSLKILDWSQRKIPLENLHYLKTTLELLRLKGKRVVLYLEPYKVDTLIHFNQDELRARLGPEIGSIFNHLLEIPAARWSDHSHLNATGSYLYSQLVACQIKTLGEDSQLNCQSERDKLAKLP